MSNEKDKLDRLQELSETLPFEAAGFDADDVRVRLGRARRPRAARWSIAAAAVLALALTHAVAFRLGSRGSPAADELRPDPLAASERILTRASELDPGAPAHVLNDELGALRSEILTAALPQRLNAVGDRRATLFLCCSPQSRDRLREPGQRVFRTPEAVSRQSREASGAPAPLVNRRFGGLVAGRAGAGLAEMVDADRR